MKKTVSDSIAGYLSTGDVARALDMSSAQIRLRINVGALPEPDINLT